MKLIKFSMFFSKNMNTISNNRVFDWYRHYKQEETIDSIESRLTNESSEGRPHLLRGATCTEEKKEKKTKLGTYERTLKMFYLGGT